MFPGLGTAATTDALWYASNSIVAIEMPVDLTHPQNIRQWHREQQTSQALPPELQTITPETSTALPKEAAVKINKLFHRSTAGD